MEVINEGMQDNINEDDEEDKEGEEDEEEDPEEGDEGLQQYCEPEQNAVQELENEAKEKFNVEEYNKFKLQLD